VLTSRIVGMEDARFDLQPVNAAVARAALMRIQRCGDLPGLYRSLQAAAEAAIRSPGRPGDEAPPGPSQEEADGWRRLIDEHRQRPDPPAGCTGERRAARG
jgi:hypothetical protein